MVYERQNAKSWQPSNRFEALQAAVDSDSSDDDFFDTASVTDAKDTAVELVPNGVHLPSLPPLPSHPAPLPPHLRPKPPVKGKLAGQASIPSKPPQTRGRQPHIVPTTNRPARVNRKLRVNFNDKQDNAAKAAFRRGKAPTKTFHLKKPSLSIESNRPKVLRLLEEIGVRFGSYIRPPQYVLDCELLLWGDERQTANTVRELQQWVLKAEQPSNYERNTGNTIQGKDKFAKVISTLNPKYEAQNKKLVKEAKLHQYQQVPAQDLSFQFIGYFLWPRDEVNAQDLLGQSCEAFDSIRIHCHAHIVFDSQLSAFKIMSNDQTAVQDVIKRIEGTMREFVARNSRPIRLHLVDPPTPAAMQREIKMLDGPPLRQGGNCQMLPALTGGNLGLDELKVWFDRSQAISTMNKGRMEHALQKSVARLPYYRGRIHIRVLLGTFALNVFRWSKDTKSVSFETFSETMVLSRTQGTLIRDLGLKISAEQIIAHCYRATRVFVPTSAHMLTLEEVLPIHTARYDFRLPNIGSVRLEVEVKKTSGTNMYEFSRKEWTRHPGEADRSAQPALLELFTARLEQGISWKLQIANENPLDPSRITPAMESFADAIKFRHSPKPELTGAKMFFSPATIPVDSFEQKTSLRYRLRGHGAWIFEIARYDSYEGDKKEPKNTQWGATFWNGDWDVTLAENGNLSIGQAATWDARLPTFFDGELGEDGEGAFAQNLRAVLGVLDGMKGEAGDGGKV